MTATSLRRSGPVRQRGNCTLRTDSPRNISTYSFEEDWTRRRGPHTPDVSAVAKRRPARPPQPRLTTTTTPLITGSTTLPGSRRTRPALRTFATSKDLTATWRRLAPAPRFAYSSRTCTTTSSRKPQSIPVTRSSPCSATATHSAFRDSRRTAATHGSAESNARQNSRPASSPWVCAPTSHSWGGSSRWTPYVVGRSTPMTTLFRIRRTSPTWTARAPSAGRCLRSPARWDAGRER